MALWFIFIVMLVIVALSSLPKVNKYYKNIVKRMGIWSIILLIAFYVGVNIYCLSLPYANNIWLMLLICDIGGIGSVIQTYKMIK